MRNVRGQSEEVFIGKVRGAFASCLLVSAAVLGLLATNQAQVQTCTPPPPNMVSWWPGDGNANDIQGSNNGTLQNGANFAPAKVGQGFSFDGVDDYVRVPDSPNLYPGVGSFTVDAWIKTQQAGEIIAHYECGGSCTGGANSLYALAVDSNGKLVGDLRDSTFSSQELTSTAVIADNIFHHVAMVRDTTNNQLLLYVDGVQEASALLTVTGTIKNDDGEADPVTIGADIRASTSNLVSLFRGIIDEVEYFNRALPQSEIQALYEAASAGKCKPVCTPPPPNLVSWWPGDENANDIEGSNNGTLQNGATLAAGKVGQAFSFDGVNDYVRVPDNPNLYPGAGSLSVDAWIRTPQVPGHYATIISHYECANSCPSLQASSLYSLYVNPDGKLEGELRDSANTYQALTSTTVVADNTFHHVAMVRDTTNSQFRLYVDGVPEASAVLTVTGTIKDDDGEADPVTLAATIQNSFSGCGCPVDLFSGIIDEVEYLNRALSQTEIAGIVNAGSAGKCKPIPQCVAPPTNLVNWYPLDELAGTTAADIFGGKDGTQVGGPAPLAGKVGGALNFDGVNDKVIVNSTFQFHQPGDATLEFWLNTPATGHQAVFWTRGDDADTNRFNIFVNGDQTFGFDYRSPSGALHSLLGQCCTGFPIPPNTWTHLTITRTGNTYRFYVNATLAASAVDASPDLPTSTAWQMSGRGGFLYKGSLDEVSIYNRALSQAEIQAIFAAHSAGKCKQTGPVADPQSVRTDEDTAKAITLNGSDPNGDALTYTVTSDPSHGALTGTAPNETYTPDANYNGNDSFTFKVNDGQVDSADATVWITVSPVNDAPVADSQSVTTNEDTAKAITLSASDADGNGLIYTITKYPLYGTLSGIAPNLTYTPNANFNGPDSFKFKVNDGTVDSNEAMVSITISPVNDAPVADSQSVTTNEDTAKAITLTTSDVDGDTLTYIITGPAHGALSGMGPNLTYTPNANYHGADSFTFKVNDGTVDSAAATVSITVSAVNDAPVADAQSLTTNEDSAKPITLMGSDVDGDALTFTITANPAHGVLGGIPPNVTYTPVANYNGGDSIKFNVNDGQVDSAVATVSITVSPVNDTPVAVSQSVTTVQNTAKAITLSGSDVDGDILSYTIASSPAHGTLSGTAPNLTYTPAASYSGADSFTFKVNDGTVDSAAATVSITVELHYNFGGFLQPIDTNVVNSANAGQTIPVKWRLTDANGVPISDPSSFVSVTSFATPGGCGGSADAIETYAASTAAGLQYLGDGNWQFNWKTPKTYAGQCRTLSLNLKDGASTRTASFMFK
jgi:hypothetical protein